MGTAEYAWQPYSMSAANKGVSSSETTRFIENKTMDGDSKDTTATTRTSSEDNNMVSTLKKLCMWEKKLHREVKVYIYFFFCPYLIFPGKRTPSNGWLLCNMNL